MVHNQIATILTDFVSSGWLDGMALFWVISAAVRALPKPKESASDLYLWFFQFTHTLLANFELAKLGKRGAGDADRA